MTSRSLLGGNCGATGTGTYNVTSGCTGGGGITGGSGGRITSTGGSNLQKQMSFISTPLKADEIEVIETGNTDDPAREQKVSH